MLNFILAIIDKQIDYHWVMFLHLLSPKHSNYYVGHPPAVMGDLMSDKTFKLQEPLISQLHGVIQPQKTIFLKMPYGHYSNTLDLSAAL